MTKPSVVFTAEERQKLIAAMDAKQIAALRTKAARYEAFSGNKCAADDLYQGAILSALEGPWPRRKSLEALCDDNMARHAGYLRRRPHRRSVRSAWKHH